MVAHICMNFKAMYDLYLVMKGHDTSTANKILIASGKKPFDNSLQAEYQGAGFRYQGGVHEAAGKSSCT